MLASHLISEIRRLGCWPLIGSQRLGDLDAGPHWFSEIRRLGCWPLIGSWRLEDFDAGLSFDLRD